MRTCNEGEMDWNLYFRIEFQLYRYEHPLWRCELSLKIKKKYKNLIPHKEPNLHTNNINALQQPIQTHILEMQSTERHATLHRKHGHHMVCVALPYHKGNTAQWRLQRIFPSHIHHRSRTTDYSLECKHHVNTSSIRTNLALISLN